jgi:8-amino-7-oxononanoate synthase
MGLLDKHLGYRAPLDGIRAAGADPSSVRFDAVLSPTEGVLDGKQVILLGTNNYLGLTFDTDCIDASAEAVRKWGTGTTGSRFANGTYSGHTDLELSLAKFYGRKHAMVFTTGYQANLGGISGLVGRGDHLILDADSHASIYDAARLSQAEVIRFRHNDPEDLYKRLRRMGDQAKGSLIVVEGIYSMMGDVAPLKEMVAVKNEMGAYLLVDEAHSMGVLGEKGRGLAEAAGVEDDVDFIIGTFSKSLGAVGGFLVSDEENFDLLRIVSRPYMFTASLPPAVIASTLVALKRLETDATLRTQLSANADQLYDGLREMGYAVGPHASPITAVIMPDQAMAVTMWNALLANGVYLNLAIPPATPNNLSLLRSSVSAAHTPEQINTVLKVFEQLGLHYGLLQRPRRASA